MEEKKVRNLSSLSWKSVVLGIAFYVALLYSTAALAQYDVLDNFNRTSLGTTDWAADPEFAIVDNELSNTATTEGWDYIAVYKSKSNPTTVSFKWGQNATAAGINSGGFALMLDSASPNASGYLVWRHTTSNNIDLWTIENGAPGHGVSQVAGSLAAPVAGNVCMVVMSSDENGHHFEFYINDQLDGTITDANKEQGNGTTLYAGVILYGGLDNNIDDFRVTQGYMPPPPGGTVTDSFDRTDLGSSWVADAEFAIENNELANTATEARWDYLAVYKQQKNLTLVSFKWGASSDATGIDAGGMALKLDAISTTANGYLLWRHTTNNKIDLWTIVNGAPGQGVGQADGSLAAPVAGDVFKVVMSSDGSGHHFACYINDQLDGTITDANKLQGNGSSLYSGVMLYGGLNNNIDDFTVGGGTATEADNTPPAQVTNLAVGTITSTSIQLSWTAPGDDGTTGKASSYDLRYSLATITEANFQSATKATTPAPSDPGATETVTVTNLQSSTKYYFALKTLDEAANAAPISNVVNATTSASQGLTSTDNFNRTTLGTTSWVADPEFAIENNELANTATEARWDYLAVYKQQKNSTLVSFKWGASSDATGIDAGGMALKLDAISTTANGYLLWRHTTNNKIDLWTIVNGAPGQGVGQADGSLAAPVAGDVFKVVMTSDGSGHHFACYINDQLDGTITDANKLQGNGPSLYSGVMLFGGLNNNIDDFTVGGGTATEADNTPPAQVTNLAVGAITSTSIQLSWTAPGDDGTTGKASSYDLRYSLATITEANFQSATKATTPAPSDPGATETVTVTNLQSSTKYYFALKTLDEASNAAPISNVVSATTSSSQGLTSTDNFNRSELGANWSADPEFGIVGNELSNTSTTGGWGYMAVYKGQRNSTQVSFKWGAGANAAGINEGGFALMLDAPSPTANGYLLWRHTTNSLIDLWTIVSGAPGQGIGQANGQLSAPGAGDVVKVILSSDDNGHHFDFYINGQLDGTVTDANKLQGNAASRYSGVMLSGNLNNNIDDFTVAGGSVSDDETAPAQVSDLATGTITQTSIQLNWTASGDDGNQGTATSYDLRYSTSTITEANFLSALPVSNPPQPKASGAQETFVVTALSSNTKYYFALKVLDDGNNSSPMSNVVSATTLTDAVPPAAVSDLAKVLVTAGSVLLNWTAPGDNGTVGQAASYDLRYSTTTMNDLTFSSGTAVAGLPAPAPAGTKEQFLVSSLNPVTTYYFALKTSDLAGNKSAISNVVSATTLSGTTVVDDFNREALGSNWAADPEYRIVSGELANTSTNDAWDYLAVYTAKRNPLEASFKWGATADAAGIDEGGLALMLDAPSANANGYLLWRHTGSKKIDLWTIENGVPGRGVGQANGILSAPKAGDIFKVAITTDDTGHHFDCFINGQLDATISDPNKLQGTATSLYAGVMLKGNKNNNIDDFTLNLEVGSADNLVKTGGDGQSGAAGQTLPNPLEVTVYDKNNNPISQMPVTFRVLQGGGTLDGSTDTLKVVNTSGSGKAQVSLTLGRAGATQKVQASAPGLTPVVFTATATSGVATNLVYVSGRNQSGVVGTTLAQPFVVKVTDQNGTGMININVNFQITQGGGTTPPHLSQTTVKTDSKGEASSLLTLGTTAGEHKVEASVTGLNGSPVTFSAMALAGAAKNLASHSGNGQSGVGGQQLPLPFVVKVTDQYGNAKQGTAVAFKVTSGDGTLSSANVNTDTLGLASTFLTLSTQADTNRVQASSQGLQGSPVTFVAYSTSGIVDKIVYHSGNNQSATVKTALPESLKVKVVDSSNKGVGAHKVTFKVISGGGSLDGGTVTEKDAFTNSDGIAGMPLTVGSTLGANVIEASSSKGSTPLTNSPIRFTATALVPNLVEVSGNNQNGVAGAVLKLPLVVKVADEQGRSISGQKVTFTVIQGGGNIEGNSFKDVTSGTDGTASVNFTLGPVEGQANEVRATATYNGVALDGSPVIFSATAGEISDLKMISGNNQLGTTGQPLENPFVVRVLNDFNVPVVNHPVKFKVKTGGGSFGGSQETTISTDADGYAKAIATLGSAPGDTNKFTAEAFRSGFHLNGSPAEFQAISAGIKQIQGISGNRQVAMVSTPLPLPFKVKILDVLGKPPKGFPVKFAVKQGGGSFNGDSTITAPTDVNGFAQATYTLGPLPGTENNIVYASATYQGNPVENSPIIFYASATRGNPTNLIYVSGNNQKGAVGTDLVEPLKVKVMDHAGSPMNNHPVTFTVTKGGGKLDGDKTTVTKPSDGFGVVEVIWTLGTAAGDTNNKVIASSSYEGKPLQGSPISFYASGRPSDAAEIQLVSGLPQEGIAGRPLGFPFVVKIVDAKSNAVPGHSVQFKIVSGGGHFTGTTDAVRSVSTDSTGIARINLTLGKVAGLENVVHAIAVNGPDLLKGAPVIFTVISKTGPVDPLVSRIICDPETLDVNESAKSIITVALTDTFGNPIANKAVNLSSSIAGDILEQPGSLTNSEGKVIGSIRSTKAGVRVIGAKDISDGMDILNKGQVVFLPLAASNIAYLAGGNQQANIGTALKDKIKAKVTDRLGNAIANYQVYFQVTSGEGSILEKSPIYTNENGEVAATFLVGQTAGLSNVAEARAEGLAGSPVLFTANTVNNTARNLSAVSGSDQTGNAGFPLEKPFVVKVTDSNDLPIWNYPVTFEVIQGNGNFYGESSKIIRTDFLGHASAQLVLDRQIGGNMARVSAAGLNGSPVSFSVQSQIGEPSRLVYIQGDSQSVTANSPLPQPLKVKVTDFFNNGIGGQPVIFKIVDGEAQLQQNQLQNTDSQGFASMDVLAGQKAGSILVEAESEGLISSPIKFTLTVSPASPTTVALFSGANQNGTVGRKLPFPLKVLVTDTHGNPVPSVDVKWVSIDGDGSFVNGEITKTDKNGIARNFLVLGPQTGLNTAYAVVTGLQGSPVIFSAQGVANKFPILSAIDDQRVDEGRSIEFFVNAKDEDGDPIRYGARNLPQGAEFDSTGNLKFSWLPDFKSAGEYEVIFLAYDSKSGVGAEFVTLTVNNVNRKPEVTMSLPTEKNLTLFQSQSDTVDFKVEAFDADFEPLTYKWEHNAYGETVIVSTTNTFSLPALSSLNGDHEIVAIISDGIDEVKRSWYINIRTLVDLVSFSAEVVKYKGIKLEWQTGSETNTAGFNILRSTSKNGDYEQINIGLISPNLEKLYTYIDSHVENGRGYYYKLEDVDKNGVKIQHEAIYVVNNLPREYELTQNYPNPFNPTTSISYQLPKDINMSIRIYNIMGQEVRTLIDCKNMAGYHTVIWDGQDNNNSRVPSGVYFYTLQTDDFRQTKRMVLLK
jgi:hypothetical protein